MRAVLLIALVAAALLSAAAPATAYRFGDTITQTGPEEMVFDWSKDACEPDGIPDLPARAFKDASNNVHLLLQHWITHQFVGADLNQVRLNCAVNMTSHNSADPSRYDDREWVASPYTNDGTNLYALFHEEFLGREHPGTCSPNAHYSLCRLNAVTFGQSNNSGATWTHAAPPAQAAVTLPYRYVIDQPSYGYSVPSNIVKRYDGYYYAFVKAASYQAQQAGACLIRTKTLPDPTSWRAWDGDSFDVRFINPYTSSAPPEQHVCQPVAYNEIGQMTDSLTFNTWLGQYLLVGADVGYDPVLDRNIYGFYYSTSSDLINWTPRKLLMEGVLTWNHTCGGEDPVQYPSLLDPTSTTRNFETTGRTMYLYFVENHYNQFCNQTLDRDLVRIPVAFPNETASLGFPRPKGATPSRISLVPAFKPCGTAPVPNRTHGPPLAYGSCSPPAPMSSFLTIGTPDANGKGANSNAWVRYHAVMGNAATTADEADVKLGASITDVRNKSDLTDYNGQLQALARLRITDRSNADSPSRNAATGAFYNLWFTVPCTPTSSTTQGSTCSVNTTADSLAPGSVVENKRAVWELNKVHVLDGGPDRLAQSQNGNTVFLVPGVFVP